MNGCKVVKPDDLDLVLAALDDGQVVGIPTDTSYALAGRLDRPRAIESILKFQERDRELSLCVLLGRWSQAKDIALEWSGSAFQLGARFWPGPLTLVVPVKPELDPLLGGHTDGVGLRHPKHRFLKKLCIAAGPLVVIDAGVGDDSALCKTSQQLIEAFGGMDFGALGIVVEDGYCDAMASTVVDCTGSEPECLREGAIDWDWIQAALYRSRQRSLMWKLFNLGSRQDRQHS